jgi:altronate dehydratase
MTESERGPSALTAESQRGPSALRGYTRAHARPGVRNHILVLPSVVCSTLAAREIAASSDAAVAITHQHGCLHVGDDLRHSEAAFVDLSLNPNVGAVMVVGLGCETIQGTRLARELARRRGRVDYVGIQAEGGSARAIEAGRAIIAERTAELERDRREPFAADELCVGLDRRDGVLASAVASELESRGVRVEAVSNLRPGAAHTELAARGAQAIVSLCGPGEAPLGFAVCPVIAVSGDRALYDALRDDFDLCAEGIDGPDGSAAEAHARRIADLVLATCAGEPTAAERRGATDFVLERLAVTM